MKELGNMKDLDNMEDIKKKQNILQKEIIDKNYDKTAFINFCLWKKEDGDDLNNWTLEELKEIVEEFVKSQNKVNQEMKINDVKSKLISQKEDETPEIKKDDIYKKEINELKDKLNKANKIIEKQRVEIQDLKNQINSFKNIDLNQINNLKNEINNKNIQLEQLRQQLQNINLNTNQINQNNKQNKLFADKCVTFITTDSSLFYGIPCNGDSTFAEVEEKLYKEYPEYRETNNTFLANGIEILRFKTVNDNKIGTGKPVILVKPS